MKTPWKNEGQQKWFSSKLPIFRGDITWHCGGGSLFSGPSFQTKQRPARPAIIVSWEAPPPRIWKHQQIRHTEKKKLNMEPETKWTFQREIPISTSFLGGVLFQFQECWIWTSSVNPLEQAELRLEPPNQNSTGNVSSVGFDVRSCWWVPKIPQSFLQKIFLLQS